MSITTPSNAFSQKGAQGSVYASGFKPELYVVAAGTYALDSSHRPSAPSTGDYSAIQLTRGTTTVPLGLVGPPYVVSTEGCDIRSNQKKVSFSCGIVLNGNPATEPAFGTAELRIRPSPRPYNKPGRYRVPLPLASRDLSQPIIENVQIMNKAGVNVSPAGVGTWLLKAMVLKNGHIALLKDNAGTISALTHADISAGFVLDDVVDIAIQGLYRSQ
jgi:hypothetical protein